MAICKDVPSCGTRRSKQCRVAPESVETAGYELLWVVIETAGKPAATPWPVATVRTQATLVKPEWPNRTGS